MLLPHHNFKHTVLEGYKKQKVNLCFMILKNKNLIQKFLGNSHNHIPNTKPLGVHFTECTLLKL